MMKHASKLFIVLLYILTFQILNTPKLKAQNYGRKITIPYDTNWVDSVFNSLNLEEKIAQLFVVRANNPSGDYFIEVDQLIKNYNIGGVTFFRSEPSKQYQQTKYWQSLAKTPLFISIDAEWGLGMRLDSIISFPFQMTLGAIPYDSLIYEMGYEIGRQCNLMGIQINFAPVVDINNNPENPVINIRSFGEERNRVTQKAYAYSRGLKDRYIIATAKHFPGHGDTDTDSHKSLPEILHSVKRLDSLELFPFKSLIKRGLTGVMIAHLYIPAYEPTANTATTLSPRVVNGLLKDSLGFAGLIVTDALDMKGVTKHFKPGEIELKAFLAGNDILLLPTDVRLAIEKIKNAIDNGLIHIDDINQRCKKVLKFKSFSGLNKTGKFNISNLKDTLNSNFAQYLNEELYKNSVTLIKDKDSLLPLKRLDTLKIASIAIGEKRENSFQKTLKFYTNTTNFVIDKKPTKKAGRDLLKKLSDYNLIILSIHNSSISAGKNFGINQEAVDFIEQIAAEHYTLLDIFANPYSVSFFDSTNSIESIIISYQDNTLSQKAAAQAIFGGIAFKGRLPVSATAEFKAGTGIITEKTRLEFSNPAAFNINKKELMVMDSIALSGIAEEAYPGCRIIAAKDGKVFYNKSFGYHTYDRKIPVKEHDIYDLASLTKIMATTPAIMKLYDLNIIDIDKQIEEYLPFFLNSPKGRITLRDLMAHQAGLQAWIPYYRFTLNDNGDPDSMTYSTKITEDFPVRVAENFYIRDNYDYDILDSIIMSPPRDDFSYKYSDLGFILLAKIIEGLTNKPFDFYLNTNFYKPLGMNYTTFKPYRKFDLGQIAPTEDDKIFRKQLIHGDVHDPAAAMLGGVAGHAGLFASANDVAKYMYLLLNKGTYGGEKFIKKETIEEFTKYQFPLNLNRRALGFDKPSLEYVENGNACQSASPESFGHSGFTGTYCWADPKSGLIYVFLCNRIHPDATNTQLQKLNIRTNFHQAIYKALINN